MENKFKKIEKIRNKVQFEFFSRIKQKIITGNLNLSKNTFDEVSIEEKYSGNKSYCNYVSFLRFYFNIDQNENK